jgi:hypothetical protein
MAADHDWVQEELAVGRHYLYLYPWYFSPYLSLSLFLLSLYRTWYLLYPKPE